MKLNKYKYAALITSFLMSLGLTVQAQNEPIYSGYSADSDFQEFWEDGDMGDDISSDSDPSFGGYESRDEQVQLIIRKDQEDPDGICNMIEGNWPPEFYGCNWPGESMADAQAAAQVWAEENLPPGAAFVISFPLEDR